MWKSAFNKMAGCVSDVNAVCRVLLFADCNVVLFRLLVLSCGVFSLSNLCPVCLAFTAIVQTCKLQILLEPLFS